jgi:uncharacterized membrane protein (DUF485 family)
MPDAHARLHVLAAARERIALIFTSLMVLLYFGFIALVAFAPGILARLIVPGLSLGILLGAIVIVASWLLTWMYVRWMASHYDSEIERLKGAA